MRTTLTYKQAVREILTWDVCEESKRSHTRWLKQLDEKAKTIDGGYILKILWDKEDGYPEQSWGYVQYTVRPYRQGYGCDGTTDRNIHLIAITICRRVGIDYLKAIEEAYPDENDRGHWMRALVDDQKLASETVIPAFIDGDNSDVLALMLSDIYQINWGSLVSVLEEKLTKKGYQVDDWYLREDDLRKKANTPMGLAA